MTKRRKSWGDVLREEWEEEMGVGILGRRVWVYSFQYGLVIGALAHVSKVGLEIWLGYTGDKCSIPWNEVVEFGEHG